MEFLGAVVFIGVVLGDFYYYGKFLGNMLVKREKKRILKKEMPDSDVKKYYRNYNPQNAWIFFFFAFTTYFPLKKAYEQIRTLYREEAAERKIELPN